MDAVAQSVQNQPSPQQQPVQYTYKDQRLIDFNKMRAQWNGNLPTEQGEYYLPTLPSRYYLPIALQELNASL